MTVTGLVRLIAQTALYRPEGEIRRGTRFLASRAEAAQLVRTGLARQDEADPLFRAPGPWRVRARR